ncbi:MAG: acyltransferase family protein [Parashewanella sp.]
MDLLNEKESNQSNRLHHLDWLRVIAIGLLVLFHTGMIYVPEWGFHFKHESQSTLLQHLMLTLSPWRMGLLWFISGVALRFMLLKKSSGKLLLSRSRRLLFPLLIGILIVVPPQLYIEMKQAGKMPLDFWSFIHAFYFEPRNYFDAYQSGIWPHIDVNHLWFLRALWKYSVALLLFSILFERTPLHIKKWIQKAATSVSGKLSALSITLIVSTLLIENLLIGDDVREIYGLLFLLVGFSLGNVSSFWSKLSVSLPQVAILALVSLTAFQFGYSYIWQTGLYKSSDTAALILRIIYASAKTMPVLAILAIASRYLNRKSSIISELNRWVFPVYIIHQTIIIVVASVLSSFSMPLVLEGITVLISTVMLCCLGMLILKYSTILQVSFGIKPVITSSYHTSCIWRTIVTICCIPLALELIY